MMDEKTLEEEMDKLEKLFGPFPDESKRFKQQSEDLSHEASRKSQVILYYYYDYYISQVNSVVCLNRRTCELVKLILLSVKMM
jgi:hypothetical protein